MDTTKTNSRSNVQMMVDVLYGDLSHLPPFDLQSASAQGLCTRLCMLAERYTALADQFGRDSMALAADPAAKHYAEWLGQQFWEASNKIEAVTGAHYLFDKGFLSVLVKDRSAPLVVPTRELEVSVMAQSPRFWESDPLFADSAIAKADADRELQGLVSSGLQVDSEDASEQGRYDLGYRDALQSTVLAAARSGVSMEVCRILV